MFFGLKNGDTGITSGQRRFNISAENQFVVTYDVYDNAGTGSANSYPFTKTVSDGVLQLKFVAVTGSEAQINAIRVTGPIQQGGRIMADQTIAATKADDQESMTGDGVVRIFPNPASSYLEISGGAEGSYTARIMDVQQRIVGTYEFVAGPGSQQLDISQLRSNELYIIHLMSENGTRKVFKFMKTER